MFPYKAANFGLVSQSLALTDWATGALYGNFYFIRCGCSRNYSTTIEALPQIAGDRGLEPHNLSAKNSRVANYTNLQISTKSKIRTSFLFVGVTGLEPARLILCRPSSQNWSETNYRLHPVIKLVPKIESNYYLPPCERMCYLYTIRQFG